MWDKLKLGSRSYLCFLENFQGVDLRSFSLPDFPHFSKRSFRHELHYLIIVFDVFVLNLKLRKKEILATSNRPEGLYS